MMQEQESSTDKSEQGTKEVETTRVHKRMGRKRTSFRRLPQPAPSVRGFWIQASDEERSKAHRLCMAILEYWLGRTSKEEIAERLQMPPLRVWQLSQQALSGMLVGLLRLPRNRAKLAASSVHSATDTTTLRQRIAELEKKLARTEDLVRVLKHLPWQTENVNGRLPSKRKISTKKRGRKTTAKPRTATGDRALADAEATKG